MYEKINGDKIVDFTYKEQSELKTHLRVDLRFKNNQLIVISMEDMEIKGWSTLFETGVSDDGISE